ncbi:kunitz trypsin inhibitor 1 [Raphanus sativus]|uniref:Kunitz trypsin inhibitor 4 n=1 Tax=Raphanus sativus TaxID=3726 RepID=A0A6J0KTE6_RAPSA|nr:kunitz trypsin inhibitor 4 [Raphanus sativus]XP_056848455.1 kunitz trypsin inhibitor 4-like [Raphanus sativus]KAJ4866714.1 kunitz trypsin inhibitor 1 [Raphanus sativus]KAJ4880521.1 kunitz trypsin inhibitor 1 [Raphanus sativus]
MKPMFYFFLALTSVFAAAANAGTPVLDSKGRVITEGSYYVKPLGALFDTGGGGLTLSTLNGKQCPLFVGQEDSDSNVGIPVKFSDWKSSDGFVPESENLNIEMDIEETICFESTYWRITPADVVPMALFIKAGPKPSSGLFQIKKSDRLRGRYRIFFCPDGYDCTKVGTYVDQQGVRRLALNTTAFYEVAFVKATKTETSSKTVSII